MLNVKNVINTFGIAIVDKAVVWIGATVQKTTTFKIEK